MPALLAGLAAVLIGCAFGLMVKNPLAAGILCGLGAFGMFMSIVLQVQFEVEENRKKILSALKP